MTVIAIERAQLTGKSGTPIVVHFNPVSLQYTVANTLAQQGSSKKQYVSQSSAKLTMDLIFDTTDTGTDVRIHTSKVALLMEPGAASGQGRAVPDVVAFEWGSFSFKGMVETYKETLDFFAPEGVPLRASVNITLSKQDKVFETDPKMGTKAHEPAIRSLGAGDDAGRAATDANAPWPAVAARAIGAQNGLASLRESAGTISLSASISLGPPVAFASGGLSLGASAGAGIGIGAGASAGIGIGGGGSIGAGASIGGAASAGVTASAGAFAGLRASAGAQASASISLDVSALTSRATPGVSATGTALFGVGGKAEAQGSTGATADVGGSASLRNLIQFEG